MNKETIKDLIWRTEDIKQSLVTYYMDEWSTPYKNLQHVINILKREEEIEDNG